MLLGGLQTHLYGIRVVETEVQEVGKCRFHVAKAIPLGYELEYCRDEKPHGGLSQMSSPFAQIQEGCTHRQFRDLVILRRIYAVNGRGDLHGTKEVQERS